MMKTNKPIILIQSITLFFAVTFLFSCQKYEVIEPDYDRSFTDYLVQTTDDAVLAAQLPILRHLPLDDVRSEIRIWVGFGPLILQNFYSFNLTEGINGQRFWYYEPPKNQWTEEEHQEFIEEVEEFCKGVGAYNETLACLDTEIEADWINVYQDLLNLDVWDLPDQSEFPQYVKDKNMKYVDGTSVLVEVKKPGYYHSYSYKYNNQPIKETYLFGNKILWILDKHIR